MKSETLVSTGSSPEMEAAKDRLLLTIGEVSQLINISVGTLYHWISEKRIPVVRFSARCVRFRRSDIEEWLAAQVVSPRK